MICNKVYEFLKHDSNTNTKHCILTFKVQNETVVVKFRIVVTVGEGKCIRIMKEHVRGLGYPQFSIFWPRWWSHSLLMLIITHQTVLWYLAYFSVDFFLTTKEILKCKQLKENFQIFHHYNPIIPLFSDDIHILLLSSHLIPLIQCLPTHALDFIPACLLKYNTL